MTTPANKVFEFGPYRLDTAERVLLRDGQPVPLTLKAFDVLRVLCLRLGGRMNSLQFHPYSTSTSPLRFITSVTMKKRSRPIASCAR
jgi:hypothetical protein